MQGKNACWVPGTDHASIATEAKVVDKLRKEGISKDSLTREEFLAHAWEWTDKHGGIILEQLKKLGASCDWERTSFTMDKIRSESVIKVFVDLYNKGFITEEVISVIRNRFSGPIYMDTKKTNLNKFKDIYIKINQRELYESTSMPERDKLIVTYGARGCGYMDNMYSGKVIEVVDVCGAGDVFLAAMVVKHLETGDMNIALPFANDKAALSCQSLGTVCVS